MGLLMLKNVRINSLVKSISQQFGAYIFLLKRWCGLNTGIYKPHLAGQWTAIAHATAGRPRASWLKRNDEQGKDITAGHSASSFICVLLPKSSNIKR